MTVPVAEFKDLHPASAGLYTAANPVGTGAGESGLDILFPHLVQRLESRRRERIAGAIEPLVKVGGA
jgi:hypothetical protein